MRINRLYNYGIEVRDFPEAVVTLTGRYPVNFTLDTYLKPISAAVDSGQLDTPVGSSYPYSYPKGHVQCTSHGVTGTYVFRHPLHEPASGVPNAVVSSGTNDVNCVAVSTEPQATTVTCRTIAGTPAASDADFQLVLPHALIPPIKMAGAHPTIELEFNGQGTVVFRNISVREVGATTIGL